MFAIHRILHPTDFSEAAAAAFHVACSLARAHHATLILLHVMPTPRAWGEIVARRQANGYEEQLHREYLQPLCQTAADVCTEPLLEEGDPVEVITRRAATLGCDLIVLGTHGRTGLPRLLMGSVAEHVLRQAPCPVLTVRLPVPVAEPLRPAATPAGVGEDTIRQAMPVEQPTLPIRPAVVKS